PLRHEHSISLEEGHRWIVDMSRLRGDAVEFDDFEAPSLSKFLEAAGGADVEPAEEKAVKTVSDFIEPQFHRRREHRTAVKEHRAAAGGAQFDRWHALAAFGHACQLRFVAGQIETRRADGALVVENKSFERAPAVANDGGELFLGDREDVPARFD